MQNLIMKIPGWGRKFRIHSLLREIDPAEGYLLTEKEEDYISSEPILSGNILTEDEEVIISEDGVLNISAEYVDEFWYEDSTYILTEDSEIIIGG